MANGTGIHPDWPLKWLTCFLGMILLSVNILPAQSSAEALSPRIANYRIDISLDPEQKTLTGTEILTWKNPSTDTLYTMPFHLYLNAFKNTASTFMQEGKNHPWMALTDVTDSTIWGWIDIDRIGIMEGPDLTDQLSFIQPDDDNLQDQTVVELQLPTPVLPGESIVLEIEFSARLPKIIARTGYGHNYFLVAQWFPKVGVYEPAGTRYAEHGQWNCHQFHASTEFYADFGRYDVTITVPEGFVVGASGELQDEVKIADGKQTVRYLAEDVIDFAWTTSPLFKEIEATWEHVAIRLLIHPEHLMNADRYLESIQHGLEYFAEHIGPYPYSTLTIVDPPIYGAGSSGMEYPTLFTGGSFYGVPDGIRITEALTIHEFGHQYFMQMIASNEMEEPWLDEGFNTYWENRVMDHYYGERHSAIDILGIHRGGYEGSRLAYTGMKMPQIAANYGVPWKFPTHSSYFPLTYDKTAVWLATLEGMVGRETIDHIFQRYYQQWKFKHPCARDFIAVVKEVVLAEKGPKLARQMDVFFEQVLYGSQTCDYTVREILNTAVNSPTGLMDQAGKKRAFPESTDEETPAAYESSVLVVNLGEMAFPTEVLIRFDDDSEELAQWDGKSRSHTFRFTGTRKIVSAEIDPAGNIPLDLNLNNNSLTVQAQQTTGRKYIARILFWVQRIMIAMSALF